MINTGGGRLQETKTGSITEAIFEDESEPITVYYYVSTSDESPLADEINLLNPSFTTSCGQTWYAWVKAVDIFGNYTIKELTPRYTWECCYVEWWEETSCSSRGQQSWRRKNYCTNSYETKVEGGCEAIYSRTWSTCDYGSQYETIKYYWDNELYERSGDSRCCAQTMCDDYWNDYCDYNNTRERYCYKYTADCGYESYTEKKSCGTVYTCSMYCGGADPSTAKTIYCLSFCGSEKCSTSPNGPFIYSSTSLIC